MKSRSSFIMGQTRFTKILRKMAIINSACFLCFYGISCEPGEQSHGISPWPQTHLLVSTIDSLTSEFVEGVFVGELWDFTAIKGDSVSNDSKYYKYNAIYCIPSDTGHVYAIDYQGPDEYIPDYKRFIAYKHGYKIWRGSENIYTVQRSKFHYGVDSICIRMVKK